MVSLGHRELFIRGVRVIEVGIVKSLISGPRELFVR